MSIDPQDIATIQERNIRVEADKAWETSWMRRLFIAGVTYILVVFHSSLIGISYPWLNSFIPVFGYLLSTISIPYLKSLWLKNFYGKKK